MSNKIIHQEELQEDFNIDDYIQEDSKRVLPIIILIAIIIFIIITIFVLFNYLFGNIPGDSRHELNNNIPLTTVVETMIE